MTTIAQTWLNEGKAEGRAEGKAEGKAEGAANVLLRLLERRFGEVPDDVAAQVRAAGAGDIDRWVDAAFDAKGLTDIFRNGVAH